MKNKLPKIPTIIYVVTKGDITEKLNSFRDLYTWAIDCRDINKSAREEFDEVISDLSPINRAEATLMEYVSENIFRLLDDNGYELKKVAS